MVKEQEAINYLENLESGNYVTINIPVYKDENIPVTAMYLGKDSQGIYDFTSLDKIEKEYYYEKETFPSKFSVIKYSDDSNENYGFVVENPIEVTSVELEYKYLNSLITLDNKKISYERIGSFSGKNNTYVDGYEIYKKGIIGRKKIGTIYISGDGSSNATKAPKGFKFI